MYCLSGTITGMLTDGLGLLGGTLIFLIFLRDAPEVLLGFGFGGTLLALFMRVGGGIYTKAADVGADLVGKVEKGIPEDDPRNAAVVADLVGDNVGDCAGMAADIFESYEVTMVSALLLGLAIAPFDYKWIVFPLLIRGIGVISTIIGTYAVTAWPDKLTKGNAFKAMDLSYDLSSVITGVAILLLSVFYVNDLRVFVAVTMGIVLAISFNKLANYFTCADEKPTLGVAASSKTGTAKAADRYKKMPKMPTKIMMNLSWVRKYAFAPDLMPLQTSVTLPKPVGSLKTCFARMIA